MTNMKYPPVEHVRHINLTRADLSARIFIVGYLPVELKGKVWTEVKKVITTILIFKLREAERIFNVQVKQQSQ